MSRTTNVHVSLRLLRSLFKAADKRLLRAAGAPLGKGPFRLYRGVAGTGRWRRVRRLSWTTSYERARWFAERNPALSDPAVYQVTIDRRDVLARVIDRHEDEYLVLLPPRMHPKRISGDIPMAVTVKQPDGK